MPKSSTLVEPLFWPLFCVCKNSCSSWGERDNFGNVFHFIPELG